MRPLNFKHRMISVLLVIALMLPSCSVYKKSSASLDEAVSANARVVVINTDGSKHKFTRITQVDNEYYGEMKTISGTTKVSVSETNITSIKILDKTATTLINLGIIIIPIATVLVIIFVNPFALGWSLNQ
jgi:hypothetical protein